MAGQSKYPVRPGIVLKLHGDWRKYNKKINAYVEHTCYLWIQRKMGNRPRNIVRGSHVNLPPGEIVGSQPRDHIFSVLLFYIPKIVGAEYKFMVYRQKRGMRKISIIRKIKRSDGYEIIGENCYFNHSKDSWRKFYKTIGLMP